MISGIVSIVGATMVVVTWMYDLQSAVKDAVSDVPQLKTDTSTALRVLADHGGEFNSVRIEVQQVRDMHTQILGAINNIRADLVAASQDRWGKADAIREWDLHNREHDLDKTHHGVMP